MTIYLFSSPEKNTTWAAQPKKVTWMHATCRALGPPFTLRTPLISRETPKIPFCDKWHKVIRFPLLKKKMSGEKVTLY